MTSVGYGSASAALSTTSGNQTITVDCKGNTPKGALIVVTRGQTLGTIVASGTMSACVTDGTNHRLQSAMSETGIAAASTNTGRRSSDAVVLQVLDTANEAVVGDASFVSFGADALTINVNWTGTAIAVQVLVFVAYGTDLQAFVGDVAASATIGTEVTETGIPFKPRALIVNCSASSFTPASGAQSRISLGFVTFDDDGTIRQCSNTIGDRDTPSVSTRVIQTVRDDACGARYLRNDTGATVESAYYECTGVTSDGFKITTRQDGFFSDIGYLALHTKELRAWCGIPSLVTSSTGNKSLTNPGWIPQAVLALGSGVSTKNVTINTAAGNAGTMGIGWCTAVGTDKQGFYQTETATATSDTRSLSSSTLVEVVLDDGSIDWRATVVSYDATGATINIDDASPVDHLGGFMFLEAAPIVVTDTEQISEVLAFKRIANQAETEQILDAFIFKYAKVFSEVEQIGDTFIFKFAKVSADTERIIDQALLIPGFFRITLETEQISDAVFLATGATVKILANNTEEILDAFVTKLRTAIFSVLETERISEDARLILGRVRVVNDTENITDQANTGLGLLAMKATKAGTVF